MADSGVCKSCTKEAAVMFQVREDKEGTLEARNESSSPQTPFVAPEEPVAGPSSAPDLPSAPVEWLKGLSSIFSKDFVALLQQAVGGLPQKQGKTNMDRKGVKRFSSSRSAEEVSEKRLRLDDELRDQSVISEGRLSDEECQSVDLEEELEEGELTEKEDQARVVWVFRRDELPALIAETLGALNMPVLGVMAEETLEDPLLKVFRKIQRAFPVHRVFQEMSQGCR